MSAKLIRPPLTDAGNAERYARRWDGRLLYVPGIGWHYFDGKRWQADAVGTAMERAKETVSELLTEAAQCKGDELRKEIATWALKSQDARRIAAIPTLAKTDPRFAVTADKLDLDTFALNVANGTLDLRTGKLRPHDPADRITKLAPVDFDPKAKAPLFMEFLDRTFAGDNDLMEYLQRLLGMCLTGDASQQILPIAWGNGANGKSTLLGVIQHSMGDYAGSAPDSLLTVGRNEHPVEMADLQGKRFVVASETESGARLRTQLIKKITGEVTLKARRMYGNYFEFPRTHHLIMQTNNRPRVSEDSEAIWRRIKLIPFPVTIPAEERDPMLLDKLKAEASGILAWLVFGCLQWQCDGLHDSAAITTATQEYREESDPLAEFLEECAVLSAELTAKSADLRAVYQKHCLSQQTHPITGKAFTNRLAAMGLKPERNYSGRFWKGIGLVNGHANGHQNELLGSMSHDG